MTAFCQVDEYDTKTNKTRQGRAFMRYLFATETGELFMLAFHMDALNQILEFDLHNGGMIDPQAVDQLMTIEFLASKLTFCSSLVYLDNSFVFYSSREGDSFILKIWAERQEKPDQPYITIEQRF